MKNKSKILKAVLSVLVSLVLAVILTVGGYAGYLFLSYSRIEDGQVLETDSKGITDALSTDKEYVIFNQNLGFGAYTADFTFFMDGGTESRARSEESVIDCINKGADNAEIYSPDFILFQEIDTDSTRSFHIDQREILRERFPDFSSVFAVNYDSAYLMYPFSEPHGASKAGILTLSRYNVTSAVRRSLPISESVSKFLDLDRCYSVSRIAVENGKELVLYNVHLSAYGGSDEIRSVQMNMLFLDMKAEYEKGNYCVTGGDFNHDFTGDSTQKLNGGMSVDFGWAMPFPIEMLPGGLSRCDSYDGGELIPTCRNCDIPYEEGNFTLIVDGFLVSDNVKVVSLKNISTAFTYSDHNPVVMSFVLE